MVSIGGEPGSCSGIIAQCGGWPVNGSRKRVRLHGYGFLIAALSIEKLKS